MATRWRLGIAFVLALGLMAAISTVLLRQPASPRTVAAEPRHEGVSRLAAPPTLTPEPTPTTPRPTLTPTPHPLGWQALRDVGYLPILMYHYVRVADAQADPLGFKLSVRPDRFAEQMDWLAEQGYQPMTMRELAACLRGEAPCPAHPVAITFDDGYADQVSEALPALRRHGFPATFYIISGRVGQPDYATWDQIRELRDSGMEIGAHTISHAALTALPLDEARAEIAGSKAAIERQLGVDVVSFSYPSGDYNESVAALVREAGFTNAVTTKAEDRPARLDELPRRRVIGGEVIAGYKWYFVPASAQQ